MDIDIAAVMDYRRPCSVAKAEDRSQELWAKAGVITVTAVKLPRMWPRVRRAAICAVPAFALAIVWAMCSWLATQKEVAVERRHMAEIEDFVRRERPQGAAELIRLLGGFPSRTPPQVSVRGTRDLSGRVRLRELRYQVTPLTRAVAYLLIPRQVQGPRPAALCQPPHGGSGAGLAGLQSDEPLAYGRDLAERGFVTMCLDLADHPEDGAEDSEEPDEGWDGPRGEPDDALPLARSRGHQRELLWQAMRALDVLCMQPEVDPARIGGIGHSMGGAQTLFLAALDPRIKVVATNCGLSAYKAIQAHEQSWNPDTGESCRVRHYWGLWAFWRPGRRLWQVVSLVAPRPMLIIASAGDTDFPVAGVRECMERVRMAYEEAEAGDRLKLIVRPGGHAFPEAARRAAYEWLEKWL